MSVRMCIRRPYFRLSTKNSLISMKFGEKVEVDCQFRYGANFFRCCLCWLMKIWCRFDSCRSYICWWRRRRRCCIKMTLSLMTDVSLKHRYTLCICIYACIYTLYMSFLHCCHNEQQLLNYFVFDIGILVVNSLIWDYTLKCIIARNAGQILIHFHLLTIIILQQHYVYMADSFTAFYLRF